MAAAGGHHDQRSTTGSAQSGTEGGGGFTPGWRPDEGSHTTDTLHKWEADEQGTKRKPLPLGLQLNGLQLRFENGKWVTDAMPERPRPQRRYCRVLVQTQLNNTSGLLLFMGLLQRWSQLQTKKLGMNSKIA